MALYAFDGTSKEDKIDDEQDSNVVRFVRTYRGSRAYQPGVGTKFGVPGAVLGGWLGLGLHQRAPEALKVLRHNLDRGDTEIDVVGFSRGAAAAVHFCNEVWEKVGKKDATYRFTVVDGPHDWVNGSITATNGAAGYDTKVLERFKHLARYPKAGWFALIGAVDRDELFPIRNGADYTPKQTGEFSCFANDAWSRYGNDRGQLTVSVERIA